MISTDQIMQHLADVLGLPDAAWGIWLTQFHEQRQKDPQRDHEGLTDVLVVEGEDGESFPVLRGVPRVIMGIIQAVSGWMPQRLVGSCRSIGARRYYHRHENQQQQAHTAGQAPTTFRTETSHFQMGWTASLQQLRSWWRMRTGSARRSRHARVFMTKLLKHVKFTHRCRRTNGGLFCHTGSSSKKRCFTETTSELLARAQRQFEACPQPAGGVTSSTSAASANRRVRYSDLCW